MKKVVFIIMLLFSPIVVFARSQKEDFLSMIESIKNVQVEEDTKILKTIVQKNTIQFQMDKNGKRKEYVIYYSISDDIFSFSSGKGILKNSSLNQIEGNEPAFYLYSILESMSTSSYQQEHYYNQEEIFKKWDNLSEEEKDNFCTSSLIEDWDQGKTFGIRLIPETDKKDCYFKISYQYSFHGEDAIVSKQEDKAFFRRFVDGSYIKLVSSFLLLGIFLSFYSYYDMKKRKRRDTK